MDLFQQLDVKYTGELPTEHFQLGLRKLCELKKVSVTKEQLDEWLPEQKGVTKGHVKYMDFLNRTRFQLQFRQNSPLTLVRSLRYVIHLSCVLSYLTSTGKYVC